MNEEVKSRERMTREVIVAVVTGLVGSAALITQPLWKEVVGLWLVVFIALRKPIVRLGTAFTLAYITLLPLSYVALVIVANGGLPHVWSRCQGATEVRSVCEAVEAALAAHADSVTSAHLVVRRVQWDAPDRRVAKQLRQEIAAAVSRLGGGIRIVDAHEEASYVEKAGDLIVAGTAEAWDPDSTSASPYRALVTLARRLSDGTQLILGEWRVGSIPQAQRFPVVIHELSVDEVESASSRDLRVARGETPGAYSCGARPTRACYADLAIKQSQDLIRRERGTPISRVVLERSDLMFVSIEQYAAGTR